MESYSHNFAHFITDLEFRDIPGEVVEKCKTHLLDTLGICFVASTMDYSRMIYQYIKEQSGDGSCTLIGFSGKSSPAYAAFLNASLVHGLDFDDTHSGAIVHASTTIAPVGLALGEVKGISGRDLIAAMVAGYEVAIRVGLAAPGEFHKRGFHATPICGIFGAAGTAGKILGLTSDQIAHAMGLCGSQASGIQEFLNDGSWNKKIHPAWAAHGALVNVELARLGFIGAERVFEGRFGLYSTHVGTENWNGEELARNLNSDWETLNISLKPYPCCHFNHAFIDGALHLKEKHRIRPDDISAIECLISEPQSHIVCEPIEVKRNPATVYGVLFSLPFCVAMALVRGKPGRKDFFNMDIHDEEVLDLSRKVSYGLDPDSDYPHHFPGVVKIRLKNGELVEYRERFNRGCPENPMSKEEVVEKFLDNAGDVLNKGKAEELIEKISHLEKIPTITALTELCRVER